MSLQTLVLLPEHDELVSFIDYFQKQDRILCKSAEEENVYEAFYNPRVFTSRGIIANLLPMQLAIIFEAYKHRASLARPKVNVDALVPEIVGYYTFIQGERLQMKVYLLSVKYSKQRESGLWFTHRMLSQAEEALFAAFRF